MKIPHKHLPSPESTSQDIDPAVLHDLLTEQGYEPGHIASKVADTREHQRNSTEQRRAELAQLFGRTVRDASDTIALLDGLVLTAADVEASTIDSERVGRY